MMANPDVVRSQKKRKKEKKRSQTEQLARLSELTVNKVILKRLEERDHDSETRGYVMLPPPVYMHGQPCSQD
jgi:hypothetical protein